MHMLQVLFFVGCAGGLWPQLAALTLAPAQLAAPKRAALLQAALQLAVQERAQLQAAPKLAAQRLAAQEAATRAVGSQASEGSARGSLATAAPPGLGFGAVKTLADVPVPRSGGAASGPIPVLRAVGLGAAARRSRFVPARCCSGGQPVASGLHPEARWRRCLSPGPTCVPPPDPPRLDLSPQSRYAKAKAALAAKLAALHYDVWRN